MRSIDPEIHDSNVRRSSGVESTLKRSTPALTIIGGGLAGLACAIALMVGETKGLPGLVRRVSHLGR